jgi:DedD protein
MADKDFAHIETTHFELADTRASHNKSIIVTISAIAFVIVCFSAGFFMGEQHGVETVKGNKHNELVEKLQTQQKELKTLQIEAQKWRTQEANTSQIGELTFYNELPKQSIVPEPLNAGEESKADMLDALAAKALQKKPPHISNEHDNIEATEKELEAIIKTQLSTSARSFRIQVASFKQQQDAERFTPKLSAIGIQANIQRAELAELGVFYRVYTESYPNEQQAIKAQKRIKEELQITGLLIQNG